MCVCCVGVRNVTALGNLISWQKVDYDFNYHQMEFPCNINVLIASEGRSLLPVRTKRDEACNRRAQNSPLPTTDPLLTHTSNPPSPAWPGRGQISFSLSWDRAGSDARGCFQPVSLCHPSCHWLVAAKAPAGSSYPGLTLMWTARGMCCVLFLCVALMGCHGGSCVPQEQSWERRQTRPSISPAVKGSVL